MPNTTYLGLEKPLQTDYYNIDVFNANADKIDAAVGSLQNNEQVTGAASSVVNGNVQADKVLVSDESGKIGASSVTSQELASLSGVTGNVQQQFAALAPDSNLATEGKPADAKATGDALRAIRAAVGTPLTANTVSDMSDTNKIYVYTGSTTTVSGVTYEAGKWYYYDGTAWVLGGTYNETALETDTTLTMSGRAADAKVTGDELNDLKSVLTSSIDYLADDGYKRIYPTWEVGSIDSTTGDDATSSTNVRSIGYIDKNAVALWRIAERTGGLYVYRYDYVDGVYTFIGRNQRTLNGNYTEWLKGLSGTHIRFVNSQGNINYPNTWMTLCLHTQIGDDIEELKQSAAAAADKADFLYDQVGYYETSFDVTAGVNHSSSSDLLAVDIKQNATFRVVLSGDVSSPQIYAYYSDGTNARLVTGYYYGGTATKDIIGIGAYISGSTITANTTVNISAYQINGLYAVAHYGADKNIVTTVLGAELPKNIQQYNVSPLYAQALKNAITSWMTAYAGDAQKVPFIVHTDQHGRLTMGNQGLFSLLSYIVNWNEVSAIFNLGDTIVDHWIDDNTNPNPLLRNATLETALLCLKDIPKDKQINVYGNHDTWYSGDVQTVVTGTLPSLQYNNPYFIATGLRTEVLPDNSGLMVVYDDTRRIKYLVVASWDYAGRTNPGYQMYWMSNTHLQWVISKMSENTGHDLVIVSHIPLEMGSSLAKDPITNESIARSEPMYIIHLSSRLNALWNARKNKTAGTVSGIDYNFTNCTDNLLCAISGHTHFDGVDYVDGSEDGLLVASFDWFADKTIHFGIFDRRVGKIRVWKLSVVNDAPAVENWEAPFDFA